MCDWVGGVLMQHNATPHDSVLADGLASSAPPQGGSNKEITLTIQLFGAFRPYGAGEAILLDVPQGTSVMDVKNHLKAALKKAWPDFDKEALVDESALADDSQVLVEDATLTESTKLAILPPVCGG